MRGGWTSWLFGGLAAPLLIVGCAIAPEDHDEQGVEPWSELDPMISEEASARNDDPDGDVGLDVIAPAPLRQRDAAVPSVGERWPTTSYVRSRDRDDSEPDPLPWCPPGRADSHDKAPSDSDGTR
ncbi:hypothetical protein [Sorangium sp. So ce1335]|uniref:hypothetical protein n=1 Tax=Sorangium sp. So ce1335 TaxID=3133335 RepID=UPI003F613E17